MSQSTFEVREAEAISVDELLSVLPPGSFTVDQAAHCWRLVGRTESRNAVNIRLDSMFMKGTLVKEGRLFSRPVIRLVHEAPELRWLSEKPASVYKPWTPERTVVRDRYSARPSSKGGGVCWNSRREMWRAYVYLGNKRNQTVGHFLLKSTAERALAACKERLARGEPFLTHLQFMAATAVKEDE